LRASGQETATAAEWRRNLVSPARKCWVGWQNEPVPTGRHLFPRRIALVSVAALLISTTAASAATLTGAVTNGTTNKPSAGDEVILIKLAAGMEEAGHTKTDAQGKFTFTFDDANTPHLIRAIHQGATYHQTAPPGTNSVSVQVYDVSRKVEGVKAIADLMYLQSSKGQLGITRIFAVDNTSNPPRTQMNDTNFEFYAPENAEIDEAQAQTAGGQPVRISPRPQTEKGRYAFAFPLRPGKTEFQVTYHLPYGGKATIDPRIIYPLQHFVAMMPRTIAFTPAQSGVYEDKQPPDLPDAIAEVASNPQPGQTLGFEISGEGMLQDQSQNASNQSGGESNPPAADNRPGGGLGKPIESPDPLEKTAVPGQGAGLSYRVITLFGLGVVLIAGAVWTVRRSAVRHAATIGGSSTPLLDALKEEIFQLEMEHKQGQLSDKDYSSAKAALDQTLSRAIRRQR
jgi:hypothetical protein